MISPRRIRSLAEWADLAKVGTSRRQVLGFAAMAGCIPTLAALPSVRGNLTAEFSGRDGSRVVLNYWDAENFQLVPLVASADTWVVRGRIYLVVRPSIINAGTGRVLWVGKLRNASFSSPAVEPPLRPTALAAGVVEAWALGTPVQDVLVSDDGPGRPAGILSVARVPRLATAQSVVGRRMSAAMDMGLCGNSISQITATWRAEITAAGLAVVGGDAVRLTGPIWDLRAERPRLPAHVTIEDFRLRPSGE